MHSTDLRADGALKKRAIMKELNLEHQMGLLSNPGDCKDNSIVKEALETNQEGTTTTETTKELPLSPIVTKALRALRDSNPQLHRKLDFDIDSADKKRDECLSYWNRQQRVVEVLNEKHHSDGDGIADIYLNINLGGLMVRIIDMIPFMTSLAQDGLACKSINLGGTDVPIFNLHQSFLLSDTASDSSFRHFNHLTSLYIGGCGISNQTKGIENLVDILNLCGSIEMLDLRYNDFSSAICMNLLSKALSNHHSIKVLHLEGNGFKCHGASAIGDLISKSKSLEELYLGSNEIGIDGAKDLARGLEKGGHELKKLYIEANRIGVDGAEALRFVLVKQREQKCKVLEKLYFENNNLSEDAATELGRALNSDGLIDGSLF